MTVMPCYDNYYIKTQVSTRLPMLGYEQDFYAWTQALDIDQRRLVWER